MMFIIYLFFLIFAVYFRIVSLKYIHSSTDEAFHFYYIDFIKKNNHILPDYNNNVLGKGPNACTYPSMYHLLLSYLPMDFLRQYGKWTALIYDFLIGSLLSLLLFKFYNINSHFYFLITGLCLIFPSLIFPSIGPRSFSLTPRNFSQFIWYCSYLCLLSFLQGKSVFWLQLAALLCAINILSSKFFVQYIFLISFFALVVDLTNGLYFFLNSIFFAIIIGRKSLYKQLKGHLEHSWWYINDGIKFIQGRWQFKTIFYCVVNLKIRQLWQVLMFQNPITRGGILNLPVFLFIISNGVMFIDPLMHLSCCIIISSLFYFFLTQFSYFRAFGEPERYIEYTLIPFLFVFFSTAPLDKLIILMMIYCLIFCAYIVRIRKNNDHSSINQDIVEVADILKSFSNKRILCTANNETYIFSTSEDKILLGAFINNKTGEFYHYFYHIYPEVNSDNFLSLVSEYNITHVVINKKSKISHLYDTSTFEKILENNHYKLFAIKGH